MDEQLPLVVYGDPIIDEINGVLWGLEVPQNSDAIQRLQSVVLELERAHNEIKVRTSVTDRVTKDIPALSPDTADLRGISET